MIKFNIPASVPSTHIYVSESINSGHISGDGIFTKKCHQWLEEVFQCKKALLTTSCTHALEMAAILLDIQPGDEVIMPSYTFVSTANAFVLRGAKIIFVDIDPLTMNIDVSLIRAAITKKTKVIVPVHYAGMSCEMDLLMTLAEEHAIYVVEDAAQSIGSCYKGKPLGSFGHLSALSFHETKNLTSAGEGGALIINDEQFLSRAEIIREKGTNRSQFFRGQVAKYNWVDIGSSYLMNDVSAAYLWSLLIHENEITNFRLKRWNYYEKSLLNLEMKGHVLLQKIPVGCLHNAHIFFIKTIDIEARTKLIDYLKNKGIMAVFHYIPLHSSIAGLKFSEFSGLDKYTTKESERLLRLPLYFNMEEHLQDDVIKALYEFYGETHVE